MLRVLAPVELVLQEDLLVLVVLLSLGKVLPALLVLQHQLFLLLSHLKRFTFLPYLLFKMKTVARDVQIPRDQFIPPQPVHQLPSQPSTITIVVAS